MGGVLAGLADVTRKRFVEASQCELGCVVWDGGRVRVRVSGHVAWFTELGWAVHSVVGLRVLDKGGVAQWR